MVIAAAATAEGDSACGDVDGDRDGGGGCGDT